LKRIQLNRSNLLGRIDNSELESMTRIGRIGVYTVWFDRCGKRVVVADSSRVWRASQPIVLEISVYRYRGGWCTNYTRADRRYAGSGITPRVYELFAKHVGIIYSGDSQSAGGRSVWNTLARRGRVNVGCRRGNTIYEVEPTEYSEVDSPDIDVYNSSLCRLIAFA